MVYLAGYGRLSGIRGGGRGDHGDHDHDHDAHDAHDAAASGTATASHSDRGREAACTS